MKQMKTILVLVIILTITSVSLFANEKPYIMVSNLTGNLVDKVSEIKTVLIENGLYQGYGFVPSARSSASLEDISRHLIPQSDNSDIQRLLRSYFRRESDVDVFELELPLEREGQFVLSLF